MKKVMAVLLMGLLMFSLAGTVLALEEQQTASTSQEERRLERELRQEDRETARAAKLELRREFSDELDQLNVLQRDNLAIRIEINKAHQQVRNLILAALEDENKEALEAAREAKQELVSVNKEIGALHEQLKVERQGFKDALKNNSISEAQSHLDNMLETKESINAKLRIKIDLLQGIITILS